MQAEAAQKIDEALSPTAINSAVRNEVGSAVKAEIETGMNLGWRRKHVPKRGSKPAGG